MTGIFFFQHSALEVIPTARLCVQFCSEIGVISNGIPQKTEIPFVINASFDHCCWTGIVSEQHVNIQNYFFPLIFMSFVIENTFIFMCYSSLEGR